MEIAALLGVGLSFIFGVVPAIGAYFVMRYRIGRTETDLKDHLDDADGIKHRLTVVETEQSGVMQDLKEIKKDVKDLLRHFLREK